MMSLVMFFATGCFPLLEDGHRPPRREVVVKPAPKPQPKPKPAPKPKQQKKQEKKKARHAR